jgi:hypothetical protein
LRNISQNIYGPIDMRSDCATAGFTSLYCNLPISRATLPFAIGMGASQARGRPGPWQIAKITAVGAQDSRSQ